ncbi:hypothetical protein ACIP1G_11160 [Pseudomonas sp. NPDC089392]|uniref:hypothetical protein n=1 Tax=Pseudomonas sp. NPDC089392 TaxID=3364459 RepID=UPI00382A893A
MPTENRSSSTDPRDLFISLNPLGLDEKDLRKDSTGFEDQRTHSDYLLFLAGYRESHPEPQPHAEPIAWMVGTAFWWTKEEAERDAAAAGMPIVGLGPMTTSVETERLTKATAFVQRLVDCSGTQPSVATGYLRDILDELKGNTKPTAPVDLDERAAFEHHHRICDLVRDEDCPDYYRNQSVQDSWEGWQARAEQEIRP